MSPFNRLIPWCLPLWLAAACGAPAPLSPAEVPGEPPEAVLGMPSQTLTSSALCLAGEARACTSLASSYSGGQALCRSDGSSFDVSTCTLVNDGHAELVKPRTRDSSRFAHARANNGAPSYFWIRPAPPGGKRDTFIIVLEGGGGCDDFHKSCLERDTNSPDYTRGTSLADGTRASPSALPGMGGILSDSPAVNPEWHDANLVYAEYVSSDWWTGSGTSSTVSTSAGPFYFNGRANLLAILQILKQRFGLQDVPGGGPIIIGGTSAGAAGVATQAELIADEFPVSRAARLRLIIDGTWDIHWRPGTTVNGVYIDPSYRIKDAPPGTWDVDVLTASHTLWRSQTLSGCEANSSPGQAGACLMPGFFAPALKTAMGSRQVPFLILQSSRDTGVGTDVHNGLPFKPDSTQDAPVARLWRQLSIEEFLQAGFTWQWSGKRLHHTVLTSRATDPNRTWAQTLSQTDTTVLRDFISDFVHQRPVPETAKIDQSP